MKEQIDEAAKTIRQLKKLAPWLLPQHAVLEQAKTELRQAERRYQAALKVWDELGATPNAGTDQ